MDIKLDILILAAHPDDAELGCGGTIAKHVALGHKVGVVDFTRGELGTRGTVVTRDAEASVSSKILRLTVRENLNFRDGFYLNDEYHQRKVAEVIRKYQPEIVLANAIYDRHPDHGKGAGLSFDSCFISGLSKVETTSQEGMKQQPWRPKVLYHFIQSQYIQPDFIVDISSHWTTKMDSIRAFKSQFYDPQNNEPETYISNPSFMKMLESRAQEYGHAIGVKFGEGFTVRRSIGVDNLFSIR